MREKVDAELDRLQKEGIISPIQNSPWAAPIVPVLKPDQSVRICGDYRLTANKVIRLDTYPIPRFDDLMVKIGGGSVYSKLDMSQAYSQLCLEEDSKQYTVINTQKGLFKYNRLSFGISAAPGIFQRMMEGLLKDIAGVACYLDDILISGTTIEEHNDRLHRVLARMESAGLKLRLDKCHIDVPRITYLGFVIDKSGVHPTEEKIRAVVNAPAPQNVTQLQSYLGMFNFSGKFVRNVSTLLGPLHKLLQKKTKWKWGEVEERAFQNSKKALVNSDALVHFDPKKPIVVIADSSSYGIGAVICHTVDGVERPICFASRTLSSAEKNYPQIEKEALALVFAVRKFNHYLWGQPSFTLVTDHKPLLGLFQSTKPISPQASGRIQRWSLMLQSYNFVLKHRSGKVLGTADALSRLPQPVANESTPVPGEWELLVNFLDWSPVTGSMISKETAKDPVLSKVFRLCQQGWVFKDPCNPDIKPYLSRRDEMSLQDGCVLWGNRVIIPAKLRELVLKELHSGHAGISRMKELARSYLWWPGLDNDLEKVCKSCEPCLQMRAMPQRAELHPWEWPRSPWHRLHVDYAGPVKGNYFLIIVDAHSKWCDIFKSSGTTTRETIDNLSHCFRNYGLPISLVTDNGPCFTSDEFRRFMDYCGIHHIKTAVYKPSTNGLAERMVQTFKRALKTSKEPVYRIIDRFLYTYRNTPHTTTGITPGELMFNRKLRTRFDLLWPKHKVLEKVHKGQERQKELYTQHPRKVDMDVGDTVMVRDYTPSGQKWVPAEITSQTGPLSYKCTLANGVNTKRHQDQMLPHQQVLVPKNTDPVRLNGKSNSQGEGELASEATPPVTANKQSPQVRRSGRTIKPPQRLNL